MDLLPLGDGQPPIEDPDEAAKLVRAALEDSIRVRVDTDLTVGVILSGGLDSSLALLHVARDAPRLRGVHHRRPGQRGPGATPAG